MIAHPSWRQTAVIYQIYPWSFQDSNGDGIGDIEVIQDADGAVPAGAGPRSSSAITINPATSIATAMMATQPGAPTLLQSCYSR